MQHIASWWHRMREAARILVGPTPMNYKTLWLKTHIKATLCGLRSLVERDKLLRDRLFYKQQWYQGVYSEVDWWRQWYATDEGQEWLETVQNAQSPVQDNLLAELVPRFADASVQVLDVGSGPTTHLGYECSGKRLEITTVDPLADTYERMLKELQVTTPVNAVNCNGERLLDRFEPQSFDIVYASNSLDHAYDPLTIIDNMLEVVKRDGFVFLRHYRNEAETAQYHGLHQWNFDVLYGELMVWNKRERCNLSQRLADKVRIECRIEQPRSHGVFDHTDWVVSVLRWL